MSKYVTICPFILTQHRHWTDRQTDSQTELVKQYRALHAMPTNEKKWLKDIYTLSSLAVRQSVTVTSEPVGGRGVRISFCKIRLQFVDPQIRNSPRHIKHFTAADGNDNEWFPVTCSAWIVELGIWDTNSSQAPSPVVENFFSNYRRLIWNGFPKPRFLGLYQKKLLKTQKCEFFKKFFSHLLCN